MRKRAAGLAVWIALAFLLYFFENNTGTRIVLAGSLLLPLVPALRRGLLEEDGERGKPRSLPRPEEVPGRREEESGGVRAYLPGDPVNRIHWKLSAKRDELLIREREREESAEKDEKKAAGEEDAPAAGRSRKRLFRAALLIFLAALLLLGLLPSARRGGMALLNRLFEASEAVNAYAYVRLDVPAGQPVTLAAALAAVLGLSLLGMVLGAESRWPALVLMAGIVLFQVYFGLSLPAGGNVVLFALFVLRTLRRPRSRKTILTAMAGIGILSLAVLLIWPGTDAATEAASEAVRDRLSRLTQSAGGTARELPAGEKEVRHVLSLSLTAGDGEARPEGEYRLETVEEQQIARPHWVSYLRIALLLLGTVALVTLPFLPFLLLNRRRRKALEARKAFESEDVREAVTAIFQHVIAWLEATGHGRGNALYAAWDTGLSPGYPERFAACEKLFEEAAYSSHEMREEHRRQALALLNETEQTLWRQAGWKTRLRLRYGECLWE